MEHVVYFFHNIKEVEKAVMNIGLGKKHGQYFIFIVALDAAICFVLFHAA